MQRIILLSLMGLTGLATAVSASPRPLAASGIVAVSAGGAHSCALTAAGGVKCWGSGAAGQLGDGTNEVRRYVPVTVVSAPEGPPLTGVVAVAAGGAHTCALTTAGGVKCWGDNLFGQLGNGTTEDSATPVDVVGLESGAVAIDAGGLHSCALTTLGGVRCWGRNTFGQLGATANEQCLVSTEPEPCSLTPLAVASLEGSIVSISAGGNYTCGVTTGGGVKCWGIDILGELGALATEQCFDVLPVPCSTTPLDVCQVYDDAEQRCEQILSDVADSAAGISHTCAVTTIGGVKCWGENFDGQLGDGVSTGWRSTPSAVCQAYDDFEQQCAEPLSGATAVTVGAAHTCALTGAGGVKCWGDNLSHYQLGDGQRCGLACPTPVDVCADWPCSGSLSGAAAVSAGASHTCVATTDGEARCWGSNFYGQLGSIPCCDDHSTPVNVGLPTKLTGDADCSGEISSIDALLVLQFSANLTGPLPCAVLGDADGDGAVSAADASLILQYEAGLVERL